MSTPSERLEARRQTMSCRVCAWLSTLDDRSRKGWIEALSNSRYSNGMVSDEIMLEIAASELEYAGEQIGESSVGTHRRGLHR